MSDVRRRFPLIGFDGLVRAEGRFLLDGATAVLKGALESEVPVAGIVADIGPITQTLWMAAQDPAVAKALQRNRLAVLRRRTPERRLVEAGRLAAYGERAAAVAVVLNGEVPRVVTAIERGGAEARSGTILLVIDDPQRHRAISPWSLLCELGIPVLEPRNLDTMRTSIRHAARLALDVRTPVAIIVDESLLRSYGVLEMAPNREVETVDVAIALRRRRLPRIPEQSDLLELARRLDLTRTTAMPSPGEVEPLGIISTGIASTALMHLLEDLRLTGRVPTAQLDLVSPLDPAPIERMLARCRQVVLLETRPGRLAGAVLGIAESLRSKGDHVAELVWRDLPGDGSAILEPGDAARPSVLLQKLAPLLEPLRPSLDLAARVAKETLPSIDLEIPPRRGRRARMRLLSAIRRAVVAAERELRRGEEDYEPMALAINGRQPSGFAGQIRSVEILERHDLLQQIVPMVASRGDRSWVLVISDSASNEELDAARLIGAAVPSDLSAPPSVTSVSFKSEADIRNQVMAAARATEPSILVVRQSMAPGVLRADLEVIDRLGYAQSERLRSTIDKACGVRGQEDSVEDRDVEAPSEILGTFDFERTHGQRLRRVVLRIRPLVEVAEVLRTRPPLPRTPVDADRDLPAPTIRHASQGVWRAHIAGVRGVGEGAAASAIVLAGIEMGFNVRAVHLHESIGTGRSAWVQILFMQAGRDEHPPTRTAGIPSGDADLILGIDPIETIRALGFDPQLRVASNERTSIVANLEPLADQQDELDAEIAAALLECAQSQCIPSSIRVQPLATIVERQFGNERLLDMVMLGISFQSGLIPVTPAAMRLGVARVEEAGFGRSSEAFEFGRHLGEGERRARSAEPIRTVQAALREVVLETRFSRGTREATRLRDRLQRALDRMPGLLETELGRRAAIDFIAASAALLRWGNRRAFESFVDSIEEVYRSDRGDTGRELTRNVILVVGEALLIRDLPYAASVALSVEHRRRVRRRLGVRTGRGDTLEIAYLIRADLQALGFRLRVHIPAREWLLRLVIGIGRALPDSIRGATVDRARRNRILAAVARARSEAQDPVQYRAWCAHFNRLHSHAVDGSLLALTLSELDG